MKIYLACFDIEDDRCRRKLSDLLLSYGERVQYSVFEITVSSDSALKQLKRKCETYVAPGDSLRFYWLPHNARRKSFDIWDNEIARFPQAEIL